MSMAQSNKPPCSSGSAACNPAESDVHSVADPDLNQRFQDNDWPRYLVIKSTDNKSIIRHNFFVISKAIQGIAGTVKNVSPQKKADIIVVEVSSRQQSINLLDTKNLHDIPVEITAHRTMNTCKGVVTCNFVEDLTDKEMLENLNDTHQRVKDITRITTMKDGKKTPTNTFIVTFNQESIPDKMYIGSCRVSVRKYIPNPRRCYRCQKFRHTAKFCKETESKCGRCGQIGHEHDGCDETPCCVNCKGDHPSSSRTCPVWKHEKSIVELQVHQSISFYEAVKRIENQSNSKSNFQTSYSAIVSSSNSSAKTTERQEISCQTDLTWPDFMTSPVLTSDCIISNFKVVEVQTATGMDLDNTNFKRTREVSLSSNEESLPTIENPPKRNSTRCALVPEKINKSDGALSSSSNAGGESTEGGETGDARRSRSPSLPRRGRTSRRGKPPDQSVSPVSRYGCDLSSRTGTGRKPSPIKLPH